MPSTSRDVGLMCSLTSGSGGMKVRCLVGSDKSMYFVGELSHYEYTSRWYSSVSGEG